MKKLIELDAALDALREVIVPEKDIGFGDELTDGYNDEINMAVTVVSALPTVDAVPAVHGRWIDIDSEAYTWKIRCSKCGYERSMMSTGQTYPMYCEDCGARMDGKDGEHHD